MTNLLLQGTQLDVSGVDALLISIAGVLLIMFALALLIGVIYLMKWILKMFQPMSKLKAQAEATPTPVAKKEVAYAKGSCGDLCLNNVSEKDAAMVMAIVADQLQTPLNQLRFKSIKEVGEDK
ncbi:MAG: OadG family protein [Clostridia bacterium]|nr:OadG family protein [Clostridia bacterium]